MLSEVGRHRDEICRARGERCLPLLAQCLRSKRILHRGASAAQLRGGEHHVTEIAIVRRGNPEIRFADRRAQSSRAEKLTKHDITHAEAERRQVDATERF